MELQRINPYIRRAIPSVLAAGTTIRRRIIFDYELLYVESGAFQLVCDGVAHPCCAGQFLLLRPGVPHSFEEIDAPLSQPHVHFDLAFSSRSARTPICFRDRDELREEEFALIQEDAFAAYPTVPYITFRNSEQAKALFYEIIHGGSLTPLARKAPFLLLLNMLIADNFPEAFVETAGELAIAVQLKEFLDAGQGHAASLDELEQYFNYSKYHLEREFTKAFGTSLIAYRNRVRMEHAACLLKEKAVTAVAEELGFSSVYVFSRAFKRHFGYPPSAV
ncbi:MAG: helix-turn-helix domain-containing protein [Ruminococcaceae bacterium]|nr:helix-turn-helix domain-containing protein [Oscillospiraceae bacterium]